MPVELDEKPFFRRLKKLYEHWNDETLNEKVWHGVDTVVVVAGKDSEDTPPYQKSTTLHLWLLGYVFPDTSIVFQKDTVHFFTSEKKCAILDALQSKQPESDKLPTMKMHPMKRGDVEGSVKALSEVLKSADAIGVLSKELPTMVGAYGTAVAKELSSSFDGEKSKDITFGIAEVFQVKDDDEVTHMRKAAVFTSQVFRRFLVDRIERIIDENESVSQLQLCNEVDEVMEDPSKCESLSKVNRDYLDINFPTLIQSGGNFKLNPTAEAEKAKLHQGVIVCSLGAKYRSYCSGLARTLIVNPTPEQQALYEVVDGARNYLVQSLRAGATLSKVHANTVEQAKILAGKHRALSGKDIDELLKGLKVTGFAMGMELKESVSLINAKNARTLRQSQVYFVSVGLEDVENKHASSSKDRKYSIWLADMAMVGESSGTLLTTAKSDFNDISYTVGDDDGDESDEEAEVKEETLESTEIGGRTLRARDASTVVDEPVNDREQKKKLLEKKRQEYEEKLKRAAERGDDDDDKNEFVSTAGLLATGDLVSYQSPQSIPTNAKVTNCAVDLKREVVLCPINGVLVPFHISTIKSATKSEQGDFTYLRMNFNTPGATFGSGSYPPVTSFPHCIYVKELSFRSKNPRNLTNVYEQLQVIRKRINARDKERKESIDVVDQDALVLSQQPKKLTDVGVRPNVGGRKTTGILELHENGVRFTCRVRSKGSITAHRVDVLFNNVRHLLYQSSEGETIVIIHFRLKNPIMIGKKKTYDVQFFTQVIEEFEQLVGQHRRQSDLHALEEEQREQQMRKTLDNAFLKFAQLIQSKSNISVDIPYRELRFTGTPQRASCTMLPTRDCLVNLTEAPFTVISMEDIEIAHFERVSFGLRNFDLILVPKDYEQPVLQINSIPRTELDTVKDWLQTIEIVHFEGPASLNWQAIMKEVKAAKAEGEWDPFSKDGWSGFLELESDNEEGGDDDDEASEGSEAYNPTGSEDEEESEDDFSLDEEDESDEYAESEEEEGMDWDELEAEAAEEDRKKRGYDSDDEDRKAASSQPKRRRR